jgi:hypothetical protein
MEDDDFFGGDEPACAGLSSDFMIEKKSTERLMNDIQSNGYRDAYQEYSENEALIQLGFDSAYKMFTKCGFLIGQIKSLCTYSSKLNKIQDLSCFLARLNNKLDKIEKQFNYENLINWNEDNNNNKDHNVTLDYAQVISQVQVFEQKLLEFKEKLVNVLTSNNSQNQKLSANLIEEMNNLDRDIKLEENFDALDDDPTARQNLNALNDLIENFNF